MSQSLTNVPFRLHGTNLFLTYPQCGLLPTEAEATLKLKLKHYEWSVWGKELHDDGAPHLHVFVRLTTPCNFKSATCLDLVGPGGVVSHGNYQVARDPKASLDYCVKDNNVECFNITLGDARAFFTAAGRKRNATELIMTEMEQGKDLREVANDYPEHMTFIMLHYDRLTKFYQQGRLLSIAKTKLTFVRAQTSFPPRLEDSLICQWLNKNLKKTRPFSQCQLWIHGPTKHGKTTLKNELKKSLRIYSVPNEDFYDAYKDSLWDLIVFDEFQFGKTITWMNSFVDGSETCLRTKFGQVLKENNLPVLVLSNFPPDQCWPKVALEKPDHLETLTRRFQVIHLLAPMTVEVITNHPETISDSVLTGSGLQPLSTDIE